MRLVVVPGPGNGKELMDNLAWTQGARVALARSVTDILEADLLVTPRGPSRSFSSWYVNDEMGQAVIRAANQGTAWIALCGSALPLCSRFGPGCEGVQSVSLVSARGCNDQFFGQDLVKTPEGKEYPFHFTSAPSFEARDEVETLGTTEGKGSVLRFGELVIASGLPQDNEAWGLLFEAAGIPVQGAHIG